MAARGNYTFGDDSSSSFDWSSILNTVVTTAGNVVSASVGKTTTATPYTSTALTSTGATATSNYSTILLLAAAGLAAFLLFSKKQQGRR